MTASWLDLQDRVDFPVPASLVGSGKQAGHSGLPTSAARCSFCGSFALRSGNAAPQAPDEPGLGPGLSAFWCQPNPASRGIALGPVPEFHSCHILQHQKRNADKLSACRRWLLWVGAIDSNQRPHNVRWCSNPLSYAPGQACSMPVAGEPICADVTTPATLVIWAATAPSGRRRCLRGASPGRACGPRALV